jgi:thioredoxin reductase (NADPH)
VQFSVSALWPYLLVVSAATGFYLFRRHRRERIATATHVASVQQGLNEPPSLHPAIDPHRCIGSGGCVHACPEDALAIVKGKAVLVNGSACIGHGACHAACPVEAITLVFGTEKRGVDIPAVTPDFQSNVPGVFIAGELGGMGLIRKAAEQGRQAIETIRRRKSGEAELDVLIVGAGPAGLSAGLGALEHRLRYRLIEQEESLGGSVYHYPRHKIAMTSPVKLALVGTVRMGEIQKEKLLEFWQGVVGKTGLKIGFNERMEAIERQGDTFVVKTNKGQHHARSVLLAIGRRGTPRKLGAAGEDLAKVVYKLVDPSQYRGQAVLVVGGGDSALEAAIALAEEDDVKVTLSYRSATFSRVKEKNRQKFGALQSAGRIDVRLETTVEHIEPAHVDLKSSRGVERLRNDAVVVCAGGELPTAMLRQVGIAFDTKYGTA